MIGVITDLVRPSSGYTSAASQAYSSSGHSSRSHRTTLLPSFASLQEHASRKHDSKEDEVAPLPTVMGCHLCTKLKPLVREVCAAVVELDELVQISCNKSNVRVSQS